VKNDDGLHSSRALLMDDAVSSAFARNPQGGFGGAIWYHRGVSNRPHLVKIAALERGLKLLSPSRVRCPLM